MVGGNMLYYSGDVTASTADIPAFTTLINSTLSTKDAAMMMMDIKHYNLGTPLPRFKYIKMLLSRFPEELLENYNLGPSLLTVGFTLKSGKACIQPGAAKSFGTFCLLPCVPHTWTLASKNKANGFLPHNG
jgi:hypothetical protein